MTIRVRPYEPVDKHFILALVPRFSESELPAWREMSDIDRTNRLALQVAMEHPEAGSAIFVAQDESGRLAGFVHLQTQTDYFSGKAQGYISDLAIEKTFEGQGIGRLLLETAGDWARQQGYGLLSLYVFAGNSHARGLYEKCGFHPEVLKYVKVLD